MGTEVRFTRAYEGHEDVLAVLSRTSRERDGFKVSSHRGWFVALVVLIVAVLEGAALIVLVEAIP